MKTSNASAPMKELYKTPAADDSVELPEDLLGTVSGGELDHIQKNDLFFSARMFKGMINDDIDLFLEMNRDLNLSEEAIAYCREIWSEA